MSSSSSGRSKSSNGTRPAPSQVASNASNNSNGAPPGPPNYRSSSNVRPSIRSSNGNGNAQEKRKIVGQYMLGKTIGEGTFGKVKLAIHIPTGEKVLEYYIYFCKFDFLNTLFFMVCCSGGSEDFGKESHKRAGRRAPSKPRDQDPQEVPSRKHNSAL